MKPRRNSCTTVEVGDEETEKQALQERKKDVEAPAEPTAVEDEDQTSCLTDASVDGGCV